MTLSYSEIMTVYDSDPEALKHAKMLHQLQTLQLFMGELPDQSTDLFWEDNPCKEFHLFNKLPIEIRLKIWHLVQPRTIKITRVKDGCLRSTTPVPVTFKINRESRIETMKAYQKPYRLRTYPTNKTQRALHQHFYDPDVDTVSMDGHVETNLWGTRCTDSPYAVTRSVPTEDASTIRFIKFEKKDRYFFEHVEPRSWRDYVGLDHLLSSKYAKLRCLQEMTLIGGGKNLQSNSEMMDCEKAMVELHSTMISEGIEFSVPKLIIEMPPKNRFKRKDARRELHKKMREEDKELRLQLAFNMRHGIDVDGHGLTWMDMD